MATANKHILGIFTQEDRSLGLLLTPSWVSGLLVAVVSLVVVIGSLAMLIYHGSNWQYLVQLQQTHTVTNNYQAIDHKFSKNTLISDIPLLVLWGAVGLIAYWFASGLIRSFRDAAGLKQQLDYVNANPQQIIRAAVWRLVVRLVVLVVLLLYFQLTIHVLIPYAIALAYVARGVSEWYLRVGYVAWAVVICAVVLHMHVILLRLLFLKARLFENL